mmetsp:Transcript_99862/g.242858  ORF Transcript_99862/g.242858 Transcript_99862/m.242858 type:complete len:168 (+) Transcript_99862:561-1064(+)
MCVPKFRQAKRGASAALPAARPTAQRSASDCVPPPKAVRKDEPAATRICCSGGAQLAAALKAQPAPRTPQTRVPILPAAAHSLSSLDCRRLPGAMGVVGREGAFLACGRAAWGGRAVSSAWELKPIGAKASVGRIASVPSAWVLRPLVDVAVATRPAVAAAAAARAR